MMRERLQQAAVAAGRVIDVFDALSDEDVEELGGAVCYVVVWPAQGWTPESKPIGEFRIVGLTHRQAREQHDRLRAFAKENGREWTRLVEEAGWLASGLEPEPQPERRPTLRLVPREGN